MRPTGWNVFFPFLSIQETTTPQVRYYSYTAFNMGYQSRVKQTNDISTFLHSSLKRPTLNCFIFYPVDPIFNPMNKISTLKTYIH